MIKKSNLLLTGIVLISTLGMFATNYVLKQEYLNIDLTDMYKNYVSVDTGAYSVLNISGSNGYAIDIIQKPHNHVRVLRSRRQHFSSHVVEDTLFIKFTGANISQQQALLSDIPSGIIVESNDLAQVISDNMYSRIIEFSDQDFELSLTGNSFSKLLNCSFNTLDIHSRNNSQFEFSQSNRVDSLRIDMSDASVGYFQEIRFEDISHSFKDSVTLILSKSVMNKVFE